MLLVLISYFRLKDEGMEDDMTWMGEPLEDNGKFTNALLGLALVVGLLTVANEILLVNNATHPRVGTADHRSSLNDIVQV